MNDINYKEIDDNMRQIIYNLNNKGYETLYCCEGHLIPKEKRGVDIYIKFVQNYKFDIDFPQQDFVSNKMRTRQTVSWYIDKKYNNLKTNVDTRQKLKLEILVSILQWTIDLPKRRVI